MDSKIDDIVDDCIIDFINRNQIERFQQLYEETEEAKVKNLRYFKNSKENFQKTVAYVYSEVTHTVKKSYSLDFFSCF